MDIYIYVYIYMYMYIHHPVLCEVSMSLVLFRIKSIPQTTNSIDSFNMLYTTIALILHVLYIPSAGHLKNALVTLSDNPPPVKYGGILSQPEYRPCGQYNGIPLTTPTTLTCKSSAIGRFIYVYIPRRDRLSICEFEAYGYRKYIWFWQ